jgi:hypothetical protein
LVFAARKYVSPEDAERYAAAISHRSQMQRRVGAKLIVAELDRRLVLSESQREQLVNSIFEGLPTSWANATMMVMQNHQYLPQMPDDLVTPYLDAKQQAAWRTIQKADFASWGLSFQVNALFGVIEDFSVDEQP